MIQVFKIARNYYNPTSTKSIFNFNNSARLRGLIGLYKIYKQFTNKSKYIFFSELLTNETISYLL